MTGTQSSLELWAALPQDGHERHNQAARENN